MAAEPLISTFHLKLHVVDTCRDFWHMVFGIANCERQRLILVSMR